MKYIFSALVCVLMMLSCSRNSEKAPAQPVMRVYDWLADYRPARQLPDSLRPGVDAFFKVMGVVQPDDSVFRKWADGPVVGMFTPEVRRVFPSPDVLELSLGKVLNNARNEGLCLPQRRYAAVVWGRPESIVFVDSVMLIALNHYLGEDFEGYSHLSVYQRRGKTPERLQSDIAEALVATEWPYAPEGDPTVLSRLLYEGALAVAKERLTGESAAMVLGYSPQEYEWLQEHEDELWRQLVGRRLLFSTLSSDADRLVSAAPSTAILMQEAPGRAGRFLGYKIVSQFLKRHSDVGLPQLFSSSFYDSEATLRESGYTGR